jgi:cellulose synthase/poly-beta-1,6-N-acetylglucosamine synthase-like glycosyltransferase
MTALLFFWIPFAMLAYSYLLYPLLLRVLAHRKQPNRFRYDRADELPPVTIIMAVHNEQDVVREKINSITGNTLSGNKFRILVGSDASTDNTDIILRELEELNRCLNCFFFKSRRGKAAIINELASISGDGILIITDANVIMEKDVVFNLVRHFKNEEIGLVDSNIIHMGLKNSGISVPENAYISGEARMKYNESLIWGIIMGPFGGCYAIRKNLYSDVPDFFLVDDFFINMKVITSGRKSIIDTEAIVFEDVSNSLAEEFRRKVRIATGNFQNLRYFSGYIFSDIPGLSFCFLSHKVFRWLGPFFLISVFFSSIWLSRENSFYKYFAIVQISVLVLPIIDYLLGQIKIHIIILRFITYFISMNIALLAGFIKFLKGVKTNVWQPTRRNQ